MQLQTWKIQGRGAFHFGSHGIGQESSRITWSSDSLFSALVARLVALHGEDALKDWLGMQEKPASLPFVLTSTYPFADSVLFFPLPKAALRDDGTSLPAGWRPKDLKRVRFVSEGIYRSLLAGKTLGAVLGEEFAWLHEKTVLLSKDEFENLPRSIRNTLHGIWSAEKRPRVSVGRVQNSSNLFHVGGVRYAEGCGLWFGIQWLSDDEKPRLLLKALLEDLGYSGMGAERTSGYGQAVTEEYKTLDLPGPDGGLWTTLSRYLPAESEISALQHEWAAYDLERVGGWIDKVGLRRRHVNLLREGAVLGPLSAQPPFGMMVDVQPKGKNLVRESGHPVWRSGLTVAVGFSGGIQ